MSRFVKNTSHQENTYVEFSFEKSLRKYEKKPCKKVKCEAGSQNSLSQHSRWHSPIKHTYKHGNLLANSARPTPRSSQSFRARVPLLERKIYSSLVKEPKVSNYSEDMDYDVYLNDFEPSEPVESRQPDEDEQFDNIQLNPQHSQEEDDVLLGTLPPRFNTMQIIGPIPEMEEMSSIERPEREPQHQMEIQKQELNQEFIVQQQPSEIQGDQQLSLEPQANSYIEEQNLSQDKGIADKEQSEEEEELAQQPVQQVQILCSSEMIFEERKAQAAPNTEILHPQQPVNQPEESEEQQPIKEVGSESQSSMMVFKGSRIAINSPVNSFWLSTRVFERAKRANKTIEKLVEWLLKARPYLSAHKEQLMSELGQKFQAEQ